MNEYPILKVGSTGEEVKILQQLLKIIDLFPGSITGNYELDTKQAVMKFQKAADLDETGQMDEATWKALYSAAQPKVQPLFVSTRPALKSGDSGPEVEDLQEQLKTLLYYNGEIDGNFGPGTLAAVKAFQLNNKLTADGIVGRDTWNALYNLYSPLAVCTPDNTIPATPEEPAGNYTVAPGDTLYSIARQFNTTVANLRSLNNLTNDNLSVGQKLIVPQVETQTPAPIDNDYYTVVKGDSLYSIANKFGLSVDELKSLNNLTSNVISVGQKLLVKKGNDVLATEYYVKKGDSLYSIAQKYNITVDELKTANNLTNNVLQINQKLIIPSNTGSNYINYTVVKGDSLYKIASKYGISYNEIINFNNLTSNILNIGQVLKIPR